MGRKPDAIEREIAAKREEISRRVDEMVERGGQDAREVSERIREGLDGSPLQRQFEERPFALLAGALGAGVALGMASEGVSLGVGGDGEEPRRDGRRQQRDGRSAAGGMFGGIIASMESAVAEETRELMNAWLAPKDEARRRPERYAGDAARRDEV